MNINVHIGRLVLHGVPIAPDQGPLVQAAIETEMARLLAGGGLAAELHSGGALPSMPAGSIQLTREIHPTHLGQQIAQAVYKGIGR